MIYLHESLVGTLEMGRSKQPGGRQRGVVAEVPVGVSGARGGVRSHGVHAQQWASAVYTGRRVILLSLRFCKLINL